MFYVGKYQAKLFFFFFLSYSDLWEMSSLQCVERQLYAMAEWVTWDFFLRDSIKKGDIDSFVDTIWASAAL